MIYLITVYLVIGFVATFFYVPYHLRKKGIDTFKIRKSSLWLIIDPEGLFFTLLFVTAISSLWPIVVPFWIYFEITSKKENEEFKKKMKLEKEKKRTDPHYEMTLDQKIDKLKKISEYESKQRKVEPGV